MGRISGFLNVSDSQEAKKYFLIAYMMSFARVVLMLHIGGKTLKGGRPLVGCK